MVIESNVEMQDLLRSRLKSRGYRVLVIGNPERALSRFSGEQRAAECVILSTAGLGESALNAFNQMGHNAATRDVPARLLVDQQHRQLASQAETGGHRASASFPIRVGKLIAAVEKLTRQAQNAP
jgi:serine/threonine-protein kinase